MINPMKYLLKQSNHIGWRKHTIQSGDHYFIANPKTGFAKRLCGGSSISSNLRPANVMTHCNLCVKILAEITPHIVDDTIPPSKRHKYAKQ